MRDVRRAGLAGRALQIDAAGIVRGAGAGRRVDLTAAMAVVAAAVIAVATAVAGRRRRRATVIVVAAVLGVRWSGERARCDQQNAKAKGDWHWGTPRLTGP